jgi:malic enzyme
MFMEAAQAMADQVPPELLKQGLLYPLQSNLLETEIQTAARVAKLVFDSGSGYGSGFGAGSPCIPRFAAYNQARKSSDD